MILNYNDIFTMMYIKQQEDMQDESCQAPQSGANSDFVKKALISRT